jgi:hypothetical protein
MIRYGLKGMEVFYKTNEETTREELFEISGNLGLIATGGSDYHGKHKKDLELGIDIPDSAVSRFLESLPADNGLNY